MMDKLKALKRLLMARLVKWAAIPILDASIDEELRNALPAIFAVLDKGMPGLLAQATPYLMTKHIASIIERHLKRRVEVSDVRTVIRLYNPVSAALRNQ